MAYHRKDRLTGWKQTAFMVYAAAVLSVAGYALYHDFREHNNPSKKVNNLASRLNPKNESSISAKLP